MSEKKADFSRRDFLRTAGAVGIGSMLLPIDSLTHAKGIYAENESQKNVVPTRPFGKTGVNVPILGLGGAFNDTTQLLLKQALRMGVSYWDTAASYGVSEKSIGKYFTKFPKDRKKVFLVTKSAKQYSTDKLDQELDRSLKRMNTSYVDLFLFHGVSVIEDLLLPHTDTDPRSWVEKTKSEGKIRFFGFSTHHNMEDNLMGAAKIGWIDGIMLSYNFRIMHTDRMKKAVDACSKAGIGLTAMKTQATAHGSEKYTLNEKEQNLFDQLLKRGLTLEQAKLKAVWGDIRIACICSYMPNMSLLTANASAATDKTTLSSQDKCFLNQYAHDTAPNYCAGCAHICEPAINNQVPISDVMRYLMYSRCYGEPGRAKSAFKRMPSKIRKILVDMDYKEAERKCPQRMQIGRLMHEAAAELA